MLLNKSFSSPFNIFYDILGSRQHEIRDDMPHKHSALFPWPGHIISEPFSAFGWDAFTHGLTPVVLSVVLIDTN